ncbi:MAG TPA: MBL fold metallo-hydrolase, partial [Bacillota bacterium]|nr:MBL fold metallo-hydrolase [Bacillota bacterium]
MKVSVLGGGNEIGASCLHIEFEHTTILIDAGMRMHGDYLLPALGMLDDLSRPDVILVTHAHADHIGALPVIHSLYPDVPIYATPPTVDLMHIMMKDSYKILEGRCKETNTLPPYTEEQVRQLLQSMLLFPASGKLKIGDVSIKSYRAGHILGAVMFLIEGDGESLFVTGDLSFQAGRTIPGAQVPHGVDPDVLIMESTYGNRVHTDRHTEEKRLAENVAKVIENGGFALIPAFALGRAQEVLLILQDFMDKGLIPEFPIYVDGLVTPISRVYKNYPHYLKGPVSRRIRFHGDAFLTEGRCIAVHPKERESVVQGKPACIVASSGMLIGGASSWYAEQLVSNEKNAIFITGYQDEESPGRRLLNIADGLEDKIDLNGKTMPVTCQVDTIGLSAHADANEMARFVETLKPTHTLLVHGDDEARNQLGEIIDPRYAPTLVENGETYPFEKRTSGRGIVGKRYNSKVSNPLREKIGCMLLYQKNEDEPLKLAICLNVHGKTNTLICQTLKGKHVRLSISQVRETIAHWNKSIDQLKNAAESVFAFSYPYLKMVAWERISTGNLSVGDIFESVDAPTIESKIAISLAMQSLPEEFIERDSFGNVTYRLDEKMKNRLLKMDLPIQGLQVNSAQAMDIVREHLKDHPRFIRCGASNLGTEEEMIMIYFDFPDGVTREEREKIAQQLHENTGWSIQFSPSVRQDLLHVELMHMFQEDIMSP